MKETDVPTPTDFKMGIATVNNLDSAVVLLSTAVELLKQIVVNTTPKKAP